MAKRKITSSLAALAVAFCLVLLLIFEKTASCEALSALSLAVRCVIPSLFPFMVISDLIVSMDLLMPIYSLIPTEKLFRLPRCTASVILCGLLCGFPIGASSAARLYDEGKITAKEAAILCAISSHASPAFLIGVLGEMWGSKQFGLILYISQLIFCVVSGFFLSRIALSRADDKKISHTLSAPGKSLSAVLCRAIRDASLSSVAVTGYIVFFSVIGAVLSSVLPPLAPLTEVIFEFSGGSVFGSRVGGTFGGAASGFAVGFSGIAVFMQCCSFTSQRGIGQKYYLFTKIAEGIFLASVGAIFAGSLRLHPAESAIAAVRSVPVSTVVTVLSFMWVLSALTSLLFKKKNFTHGS